MYKIQTVTMRFQSDIQVKLLFKLHLSRCSGMEAVFQKPFTVLPCISYNNVVGVHVICTLGVNK